MKKKSERLTEEQKIKIVEVAENIMAIRGWGSYSLDLIAELKKKGYVKADGGELCSVTLGAWIKKYGSDAEPEPDDVEPEEENKEEPDDSEEPEEKKYTFRELVVFVVNSEDIPESAKKPILRGICT